jgi:hypothetical protein
MRSHLERAILAGLIQFALRDSRYDSLVLLRGHVLAADHIHAAGGGHESAALRASSRCHFGQVNGRALTKSPSAFLYYDMTGAS